MAKKSLTLAATLERYMLSLSTAGKSRYTVRGYRQRLGMLLRLLETGCTEKVVDLKQVTTDHLRQVIHVLQTQEIGVFAGRKNLSGRIAPSTVRSYVLVFKSFFSWCYHEGLISSNPADSRLDLPKVPKPVRSSFSTEDIQTMLDACDRSTDVGFRDFALLLLLFDTGIRLAEIATLKVENVHPEYVKVEGKGRKEREIGIHSATSIVIWKYIELHRSPSNSDEPFVFIGKYGDALSESGIHSIIKRTQDRAGLDDIRVYAHLFRHTFSKFYMENGGDLFSLSRELGHSDIQTTKIYLEGFNSTQARKVHQKFSPVSLIDVKETRRRHKK